MFPTKPGAPPVAGPPHKGKKKGPPKPNPAMAGLQSAVQSTLMQGQSNPLLAQAVNTAPPPTPGNAPFPPKKVGM